MHHGTGEQNILNKKQKNTHTHKKHTQKTTNVSDQQITNPFILQAKWRAENINKIIKNGTDDDEEEEDEYNRFRT